MRHAAKCAVERLYVKSDAETEGSLMIRERAHKIAGIRYVIQKYICMN